MKKFFIFVWEIVKVSVISLAIIIPVRYYLIQPFYVKGASMEPNFHDNVYLIVDELSYRFNEPVRGQVVVFRYPKNPQEYFIKRIIALPGEEVQIKDGKIIIYNDANLEGLVLNEEYLPSGLETMDNTGARIKLNEDEYFVLGDNRNRSSDSRIWGFLPRNLVVGRAYLRLLPINNISYKPGAYQEDK
jgi:signal peptidase I